MSSQPKESGRIVVGVDGSQSSKEALRWAVLQAGLTHDSVNAVIAWEYPPLYGSIGWLDAPQSLASDMKVWAGQTGFSGALLGSVSQHCTHHATCPVVVIRGH